MMHPFSYKTSLLLKNLELCLKWDSFMIAWLSNFTCACQKKKDKFTAAETILVGNFLKLNVIRSDSSQILIILQNYKWADFEKSCLVVVRLGHLP